MREINRLHRFVTVLAATAFVISATTWSATSEHDTRSEGAQKQAALESNANHSDTEYAVDVFAGTPETFFSDSFESLFVSPLYVSFAPTIIGVKIQKIVTITNLTPVDLSLGQVGSLDDVTPPFQIFADTCSLVILPPGTECTVIIEFSPASSGQFFDSFSISSSHPISPEVVVNLSGEGVVPPAPVILNAVDRGYYDQTGFHDPEDDSYFVGAFLFGDCDDCRNFFVFDLSSIDGEIRAAQLLLSNPPAGYLSPKARMIYLLRPVSSPLDDLVAGTGGLPAHEDLGDGTSIGNWTFIQSDSDLLIEIPLDEAALNDMNNANGLLAIGGNINALGGNEYAFFETGGLPASASQLRLAFSPPAIEITPQIQNFGNILEPDSRQEVFTVTNNGPVELQLNPVGAIDGLAPPFEVVGDTCSGQSLAAAEECTITVEFTPTSNGNFNDRFDVSSDDQGNPHVRARVLGQGHEIPQPRHISAERRGFYVQEINGVWAYDSENESYQVGSFLFGDCNDCRNFFRFPTDDITHGCNVETATLRLVNPPSGFISSNPSELYQVWDADLRGFIPPSSQLAWQSLGSGSLYGSYTVTAADNNTIISIPLGFAAKQDINAELGGLNISMGGNILNPGSQSAVFANTHDQPAVSAELFLTFYACLQ